MNTLLAIVFWINAMIGFSPSGNAGYTVTWVAPTENTDGSQLTDLDGFKLWCLYASGTYGNPAILPAADTQYIKDWAGPGDWKCKMRAFNTAGTDSADSVEVFFTLLDPDGDGNGHIDPGGVITIVVPGIPNVTVECPTSGGQCRSNEFGVTRKGYYTISGPDGVWLLKADGSTRQVTTRDEAYEWISKDGRRGSFTINPPPYEVKWE